MKNILSLLLLASLWCGLSAPLSAQDVKCAGDGTNSGEPYTGTIFFNYGSVSGAFSNKNRHSSSVGEPLIGTFYDKDLSAAAGFWTRFLAPPTAPTVQATQGELLDRIQLNWTVDALSPSFDEGFNLYRNGIFLTSVSKNARSYNDFNVIAGQPYNYEVRGVNLYGEGVPGKALGFQVPNGTVTGLVETLNGSPVPGALVMLDPMQGFSAKFGAMDGAFAQIDTFLPSFLPPSGEWSVAFWIKTASAAADAGILRFEPFNITIKAVASTSGQEGIIVNAPGTSGDDFFVQFPNSTKNGWHHVALTHDNNDQGQLYLDGVLTDISALLAPGGATTDLTLGARTGTGGWQGQLDELRIYFRKLDELDLGEIMTGTASSTTPGLESYWKLDEEQGFKSFDIVRRNRLYFCGAMFDTDRPPVSTSATTNEQGYYRIESASYGTGTTFLAKPSKNFYLHRALKFTRDILAPDYATLPDFSLTKKATLELWANSAGPDGTQTLLSKTWPGNDFRLLLTPNGIDCDVKFYLNGTEHNFGLLGAGYQHLAFTIDSSGNNRTVTAYKNGAPFGTPHTFAGVTGNWSDPAAKPWTLGARPSGMTHADPYGGLIDEIAVYDSTLSQPQILEHAQSSRNPQERGLRVYFALDEGSGNRLNNSGSVLTSSGTSAGTEWSPFAPNQSTTPHEFTPVTRQVTLNPSVTSVDRVDFIDRSTVAVSGFVRYKNTDCFAESVEILVNGERYNPAIFTDSTGRFLIDLDPGATVTLTPKFKDHVFSPAIWDVTNVVNPIAGILFTDMTSRKVTGQVAGGFCKKPILENVGTPQGTVCQVKVRSLDGCFERLLTLDNEDGEFFFNDLPPIILTVAVVEHSDPAIKTAFQVQGAPTVDLTDRDTMLDLLYFAPPQVEVTGLEADAPCAYPVLDQGEEKAVQIRIAETYLSEKCYVDSAAVRIIDGFGGGVKDTTISNGTLNYKFRVGIPNPSPPHLQIMQVVGKTLSGNESSTVISAIITGVFPKEQFFTTKLPEIPTMVLHDPPGDGSYSYIEKGETACTEITTFFENENGVITHGKFDLGPKGEFFGSEIEIFIATDANFKTVISVVNDTTLSMCRTTLERISTGDNDLIVGSEQGGDVFMGGALNIILGLADEVVVDATTCTPSVNVIVTVAPDDFATTFIYSEYHIRENIIRYLQLIVDDIMNDPAKPDTDALPYQESIVSWENILESNTKNRAEATFRRNISFDAFATYESSETSDSTRTTLNGRKLLPEGEVTEQLGTYTGGIGADLTLGYAFTQVRGADTTKTNTYTTTTGFVLADDDAGDAFTMDIGVDKTYGTPVFNVVSGQSNCPWEPGTAHREGNSLEFRDGSGPIAVDVPANEPAVFKFTLGNESATNEDWSYVLSTGPESNPHGAKIFLNGAPLDHPIIYAIPYGTSIPITVTLERGPEEYNYDSLEVVFYSLCEDDRATALGILPDEDTILYSAQYISAHFIRPCSEVDINVPEQGWVVFPNPLTPGPDDVLRITASGYDKGVEEFERLRVQYRAIGGDGAWINITPVSDILKADLGVTFTQFFWNTEGLADGSYEIRAIAVCVGDAADKPGYSQLIRGKIDRQPPSLVGVPQPSDGVYHVGDEVSFTFNKHINCNKLIQADIFNANNVGLYDATTGLLIDANITCFENTIMIDPNFQNEFFENRILRAELHNIQDLTGNKLIETDWEFFVDRNELAWLTDSMGMTKFESEYKVGTASIHNRGGYPVPFTITGVPNWVRVVPSAGTLVANQILPITFEVDSSLAFGNWSDSITLHTETGQNPFFMGGDEPLPIGVRVVCRPPVWNLNEGLYENSMNMVLELNIQGQVSTDIEDMVAVYINDELRGRARVEYVPELNKYLAYLTVYGDPSDQLDDVRLEIWDASECLRYGSVVEFFTFQPDNVIGIPNNPQVIHTNSLVLREVPFGYGWNWLSFNLAFPDPSLDVALASLNHPQNDLMKGQAAFSTYSSGSWFGSLTSLGNTTMYIYRADLPDTLKMMGNLINPATTNIPLVTGWNWIGYVPNYSLPINEALGSLPSQTGDLIKGQLAFAQYINPTFGWIGNLKYMSPPNGYQIKVATPGTLTYPPPSQARHSVSGHSVIDEPKVPNNSSLITHNFWTINPAQYEHSMTLIGMLKANGQNVTTATMELGVFAGTEVRGSAQAIYIAPLDVYQFFLTTYANAGGEQLKFKLFDSATGTVQDLTETIWFSPDLHQGSIESPVPLSLKTSGLADVAAEQSFDVQPNPFSTETMFRFALPHSQEVTISVADVNGREVSRLRLLARAGLNTVTWDGVSDAGLRLGAGVYFVRLSTEEGMVTRKVVVTR